MSVSDISKETNPTYDVFQYKVSLYPEGTLTSKLNVSPISFPFISKYLNDKSAAIIAWKWSCWLRVSLAPNKLFFDQEDTNVSWTMSIIDTQE